MIYISFILGYIIIYLYIYIYMYFLYIICKLISLYSIYFHIFRYIFVGKCLDVRRSEHFFFFSRWEKWQISSGSENFQHLGGKKKYVCGIDTECSNKIFANRVWRTRYENTCEVFFLLSSQVLPACVRFINNSP